MMFAILRTPKSPPAHGLPRSWTLLTTIEGSMMEGFPPQVGDLGRSTRVCSNRAGVDLRAARLVHPRIRARCLAGRSDFDVMLGHEIAPTIRRGSNEGRESPCRARRTDGECYLWSV